ncbi:MAG: PP0621 family protein, partial [Pseudomonadota bacterium]
AASGPEKMVVCAHCHIHVPESEAVTADEHHFCCEEHRQLGPT